MTSGNTQNLSREKKVVTLIGGDGIGPEVMTSAVTVLEAVGASLEFEWCDAGGVAFSKGISSGIPKETIDSIERTGVVLKGPLETPVGHGNKSANVSLRKLFDTFANVRPCFELPGVYTPFSGRGIDLVIVRENLEDLYASIEGYESSSVAQGLKIISKIGSERVIRFAFELAKSEERSRVHCSTKANIMKLTEGLFKSCFEEVAKDYPDISTSHLIVDNLAHQLARNPEAFEVIVCTNLHGDILSDFTSGLIGGLGFSPSGNFGENVCIFEAVHGSAPDIANKDLANPTALLLSTVMMLRHLGLEDAAFTVENALLYTFEEGKVSTMDVRRSGSEIVGTKEFTDVIISNFGKRPQGNLPRRGKINIPKLCKAYSSAKEPSTDVGIDVFIEVSYEDLNQTFIEKFASDLKPVLRDLNLSLSLITNRGTVVYPTKKKVDFDMIDVFRVRLLSETQPITQLQIEGFLKFLAGQGIRWSQVEKLLNFGDRKGYLKGHGED